MPSPVPPTKAGSDGAYEYVPRQRLRQPINYITRNWDEKRAKAAQDAEAAAEAKLLRNRGLKVKAVATAVLVISLVLFGAQIKETVQDWRKRRAIKTAADLQVWEEQASDEVEESSVAKAEVPVIAAPNITASKTNTLQTDQEIRYQIAALEDRRVFLNKEKGRVLIKLQRLEERLAREAEIEARRATAASNR